MTSEPPTDRATAPGRDAPLPSVSVILITRDRRAKALAAVVSVLRCDYPAPQREIVVVEETDAPEPFPDASVRYVSIPRRHLGFAYARTIGVSNASHELCAFIDDDCIADAQWLRSLVSAMFDHPRAAAAGGAVRVPQCGPVGQCENILGFPGGGARYAHESGGMVVSRPTFSTCNCIVRKQALLDAGGFDKRCVLGGEDELLSRAIGRNADILFTPHAIVYHEPRDDVRKVFSWFVRRGKARMAALSFTTAPTREKRTILRNSPLARSGMLLLLICVLGLPLLPVAALLCGVYYCVMLWRFRWSRRYFPAYRTLALVPLVKAVMDVGYDIGIALSWMGRYKK